MTTVKCQTSVQTKALKINLKDKAVSVRDTFEIHVTDKGLIHNEVHLISILMDKILEYNNSSYFWKNRNSHILLERVNVGTTTTKDNLAILMEQKRCMSSYPASPPVSVALKTMLIHGINASQQMVFFCNLICISKNIKNISNIRLQDNKWIVVHLCNLLSSIKQLKQMNWKCT